MAMSLADHLQLLFPLAAIVAATGCIVHSTLKGGRGSANIVLVFALASTVVLEAGDFACFLEPERLIFWKRFALIGESFLPFFWLFFSLLYARQGDFKSSSVLQRATLVASAGVVAAPFMLPPGSFFYSPDFTSEKILFLNDAGYLLYVSLLVFLVLSLINLERTLANATHASLWKIKFEILGAGLYLAVLVFYYSQGLLYRSINMNLVPARSVSLIIAVALIVYARIRGGDGVKITISRNVFYKSVVLLVVGLYLVGLGLAGEGMKYFGEGFQRSLLIIVAFTSGLGVLVILLSGSVKRKVTVFLHKNFYQNKYDYRNQWLKFTECLSSFDSRQGLLTSILSGYCDTFGMGCAAVFLADSSTTHYSLAATLEMEPLETLFEKDEAVIKMMQERQWVVHAKEDLENVESEAKRFAARHAVVFFIPLLLNETLDGFIVLGRPLNRDETYNYEDYDLMKTFARHASSAILNLHLSDRLVQAREMEAIGKVSSFVIHDLKNLVYTISLILDNAKEYIEDREFQQDMLESLGNTVANMKTLIAKLKHVPEKEALRKEPLDLLQLCADTAGTIRGADITVCGQSTLAYGDREELQKVALNLLLNAVEASQQGSPITVHVGNDYGPYFRIEDKGCGISEEFIHHYLFSPFKTTKAKGMGIGLYQCKQIAEAHGGRIDVASKIGCGTTFTVWLPQT